MKICGKCKIEKDAGCFYKLSASKDGLNNICKQCNKAYAKNYYLNNKNKIKAQSRLWRDSNKDRARLINKKYRISHKEICKKSIKKWRASNNEKERLRLIAWRKANKDKYWRARKNWLQINKHYTRERSSAMRLLCRQATPKWANKFFIKEIYHLAQLRTDLFSFKWEVDHIIPLKGKLVCGLHIETNLRVIPKAENLKKSNKFDIF